MTKLWQSQPSVARLRRQARVSGTVLLLTGAVMILVALGVFLTQGSQIRVTATVLSENCHSQYDLAVHTDETRCGAAVRFTTRSGQLISTTVTDAFPYEFSHRPGRSTTIQLRYDSSDPTQPFKQSNYMSVGEFCIVLGIGVASTAFGILIVTRAEQSAENAVRRSEAVVISDAPSWLKRLPIFLAVVLVLLLLIIYLVPG
jgi:uncharacterized BrkB/YihY/UPF0761 family membrane protein